MALIQMKANDSIIAIVGSIGTHPDAPIAAEAIGRELAKAGLRILVYSSGPEFLEGRIVSGYVGSKVAARRSVQVRYPLHGVKPAFPEQQTHDHLFDWRPEHGQDWEMSFYQSLNEVDGILLMGGRESTMIAGLVAMGHGIAMLPVAGFGGKATDVWGVLQPGRDLATADEISLMARPSWTDDDATEYVRALKDQIARKAERARQRRLQQVRQETSVTQNAVFALVLFLLAIASVALAWGGTFWNEPWSAAVAMALLFISPLLAGVSGLTVRLVFDLKEGAVPLTSQSAITTAALGLIAGGVAGLLFITAQVTTATAPPGQIVSIDQARRLVAFSVLIGFVAGLTLDAVFRKLIATDVVETSAIEAKARS
jgi:hypothetical protein